MRTMLSTAALFLTVTTATGCYHSTVVTGATPSTEVIDKPWASSFVYGLVPPSTVETATKCPDGLAKVESQQTFLNGLVGILTFGIYTPMRITVTCAAKSAALDDTVPIVVGVASFGVMTEAAELAVQVNGPVLVQFHD
jgi:hypothetical protein